MTAGSEPELTIAQFEAGDIDPAHFDHRAHVYVGWLFVSTLDFAEALSRFDASLKRLVSKLGDADKYHATLTWFYLLLIAERARVGESWSEFVSCNADLFDSKAMLSRYYSKEHLFSEEARRRFVLPDRVAA